MQRRNDVWYAGYNIVFTHSYQVWLRMQPESRENRCSSPLVCSLLCGLNICETLWLLLTFSCARQACQALGFSIYWNKVHGFVITIAIFGMSRICRMVSPLCDQKRNSLQCVFETSAMLGYFQSQAKLTEVLYGVIDWKKPHAGLHIQCVGAEVLLYQSLW